MRTWITAATVAIAGLAVLAWFWATAMESGRSGPSFSGASADFTPARAPRPVPAFGFTDAEGRPMTLGNFQGKVVLLNLWATWCQPCIREMPSLDRLQAEMGGPDFQVVALSVDRRGRQDAEPFLAKAGLTHLSVYLDPSGGAMRALGTRGLPTTLLIDRAGREIGRLEGAAEWHSPQAKNFLTHHLGGPKD